MKTFKKVLDWYEELPESIKHEAISNYNRNQSITTDSLSSALSIGFIWCTTKQGYEYWSKMFNILKTNAQ